MNQYSSMATYPGQTSQSGIHGLRLAASWHLVGQCNNEHACYVGYVWALKPWLAIVIIHQYMQKITNLTKIYHRTGSWNLYNLEILSINFELPYIRQLLMFLFLIWYAYVNLSPAYSELLFSMFIHQLGVRYGHKCGGYTFWGHPVSVNLATKCINDDYKKWISDMSRSYSQW